LKSGPGLWQADGGEWYRLHHDFSIGRDLSPEYTCDGKMRDFPPAHITFNRPAIAPDNNTTPRFSPPKNNVVVGL